MTINKGEVRSSENSYKSEYFQNFNYFVFLYMFIMFLFSNFTASSIRVYRISLVYLHVNIILNLNCFLVQTFNAIVTILVNYINK